MTTKTGTGGCRSIAVFCAGRESACPASTLMAAGQNPAPLTFLEGCKGSSSLPADGCGGAASAAGLLALGVSAADTSAARCSAVGGWHRSWCLRCLRRPAAVLTLPRTSSHFGFPNQIHSDGHVGSTSIRLISGLHIIYLPAPAAGVQSLGHGTPHLLWSAQQAS